MIDIDLTEEGTFSWPDPEIKGWRHYRIEYGGCNQNCYWEGSMWLPPVADSWIFTQIFEILQVDDARKKFEEAVKNIHKEDVGELSKWRDLNDKDSNGKSL